MEITKFSWRRFVACMGLGFIVTGGIYLMVRPVDEVVLAIGEPYEQVRQRSRSTLPPIEPNANWGGYVSRPARLRFVDPRYGFVTPPAKFFVVHYDSKGNVDSVTLSPQVATLQLDEAMATLIDLQNQFRRGGWQPFRVNTTPPIEDTQDTRAQIRHCDAPTSYWQGGNNYQISLNIRCFRTDDRPNDERYLITLDLGEPVFGELPNN
jgi:hypothetical protein